MVARRNIPPEMTLDEGKTHPVDPEDQSMFGTRRPRPASVGRHLLVVFVCFLMALGMAIYFAETAPTQAQDSDSLTAPQP